MLYTKIHSCRLCQSPALESMIHLGDQALTGIFPKKGEPDAAFAPLELVKCSECALVQLGHNFDLSQLYGMTYGYRSGLNASMVRHLQAMVQKISDLVSPKEGDWILDIGSNDGTLLGSYAASGLNRIGMDPSGQKFIQYYAEGISLIPDFFSADTLRAKIGNQRFKVITSIAMFYDLEAPQKFVNDVAGLLSDNGVWVFEQSYLPTMLDAVSYDTICHEHLEYYALGPVKRMLETAGLKIVDIDLNDTNGGSFRITASRKESAYPEAQEKIAALLAREEKLGLSTFKPFVELKNKMESHKAELLSFLERAETRGFKVLGYGASTKGNVLLQYCGLDASHLTAIAEVNPDKFGSRTPGTSIPIVSEAEALKLNPDYYLVLPWHFRTNILAREKAYLEEGGSFIFPLPKLEVVTKDGVFSGEAAISRLLTTAPKSGLQETRVH